MLKTNEEIIYKKSYMGERDLSGVILGPNVRIIEDWAFANCKALTRVCIPDSIERVSDNAFFNCDKLVSVEIYDAKAGGAEPLYGGKSAYALALMIKIRPADTDLFIKAAKDDTLFSKLGEYLPSILEEDDKTGFEPFLAGGEEDYDVKGAEESHLLKQRFLKAKLIYEWLLFGDDKAEDAAALKQTCLNRLKDHNPSAAFGVIFDSPFHRKEYLNIYLENALDEGADLNELMGMADADTEVKVTLLSSRSEKAEKQGDFFDSLLV